MRIAVASFLAFVAACGGGGGGGGDDDDDATGIDAGACSGCLDDRGECRPGSADDACGGGGEACVECGGGEQCGDGECQQPPSCGPATCDGCCDGDSCVGGTGDRACGSGGEACEVCSAALGSTCSGGDCSIPCGPDNCAGCCDGDTCVDGGVDAACGQGGAACLDCGADGLCSEGICVDLACGDTCGGCCSGDSCLAGDSSTECGAGGSACIDCGSGRTCDGGGCVVDPTSHWDLLLISASVPEENEEGGTWDSFGGLPDPFVDVQVFGETDDYSGSTSVQDDTLSPFWGEEVLDDVAARDYFAYTGLLIRDSDTDEDDLIGSCVIDVEDSLFDDELHAVDCGLATVYYRLRLH